MVMFMGGGGGGSLDARLLARASANVGGKGHRRRKKAREKRVAVVHILANESIDTSLCNEGPKVVVGL